MEIDNDSISEFERNHDIDSFVFETPFTRGGGQSQSGPREQWKRQTIIKSNYILKYFYYFNNTILMFFVEMCNDFLDKLVGENYVFEIKTL